MSLLVKSAEQLAFFLVFRIVKVGFEAAVVSAVNKIFPDSVINGCNCHFNQCLWRQRQNIGFTAQRKENEQVQLTCRMRAALAHEPINKVEEVWLRIMENVPHNDKLTLFLVYCAQQLMENHNVLIEMWNTNNNRRRTDSTVDGWNCELNSIIGRRKPNVFLQIHKLKEETQSVSWQLKSKGLGERGQKRRKDICKTRRDN